ncbi:MAG: hypothetical protein E5X58_37220 [Mesorhizobium sp.]|nr:MAG: hypothetical protein E5X58_37220 [Mesorhizobium sp.]
MTGFWNSTSKVVGVRKKEGVQIRLNHLLDHHLCDPIADLRTSDSRPCRGFPQGPSRTSPGSARPPRLRPGWL